MNSEAFVSLFASSCASRDFSRFSVSAMLFACFAEDAQIASAVGNTSEYERTKRSGIDDKERLGDRTMLDTFFKNQGRMIGIGVVVDHGRQIERSNGSTFEMTSW